MMDRCTDRRCFRFTPDPPCQLVHTQRLYGTVSAFEIQSHLFTFTYVVEADYEE